jgi:hypothetical protein
MQPIKASDIDLSNFNPIMADYGPKNVHAPSVLVTEDNIGQIALEFELDVQYLDVTFVRPYIKFYADRTADDPIELMLQPGSWIVLIWNEIHIFRDGLFQKTFDIESLAGSDNKEAPADATQIMPATGDVSLSEQSKELLYPDGSWEPAPEEYEHITPKFDKQDGGNTRPVGE